MAAGDGSVHSLTAECLSCVFSFLTPRDLAAAACTHHAWRDAVGQEDALWRAACEAQFALAAPATPDSQPLPSYKVAYGAWKRAFGRYGELATRAIRAWRQVEDWTRQHIPEVAASLRPGATEEALDAAEAELGAPLCPALRVIYRVHDGQELEFDRQVDKQRTAMHDSIFWGLFGGYSFYNHVVCTRLLPLRRVLRWTRTARSQLAPPTSRVLFAASHNFNKMLWCDCGDGLVHVASVDKVTCLQAVPPDATPGAHDGVLRWFEAFAGALAAGRFATEPLDPEYARSRCITLFPQLPPWRAEAVTEGVRVQACPLFVPELTQVNSADERSFFFTYSIRFALLSEEEQLALRGSLAGPTTGAPMSSVQLRSRHWLIRDAAGAVESEVRGEAVVGHYPLLRAGEPHFAYQSCTHQKQATGSMEGSFRFVEGSLQQPGREFDVVCARFSLVVPDVMF